VTADAVTTAAMWRAAAYDMLLHINIGSRELLDDLLVDNLFTELDAHDVPAESVVVEVAEGAFVDTEVSERIVRRLRAAGVLVSIDDFGAGYSSLSRLRALDAIELKLDRSLTAAMTVDPGAAAVVDSSIQLAHALDMRLVAEGVEDAETYKQLRDLGCDGVQGFFIARPMSATELITWLDEHS
jgi:EAL domain-containing protein (putative c-di-GMP-specific phosphodiesterase class I)